LKIRAFIHYKFQNCKYPYPNIKFSYTSTEEIEKIIKHLKIKNAHGYDVFSTKILKLSAPFVSSPVPYIFNKSFVLDSFPSKLNTQQWYQLSKPLTKLICLKFRRIYLLKYISTILRILFIQEFMHM